MYFIKNMAEAVLVVSHKSAFSESKRAVACSILAGFASKATLAGAGGGAVASWFLSSQFFGLVGLIIGALGLLANIFFKIREHRICREFKEREDQRRQKLHEARMQRAQAYIQQRSERCQFRHGQEGQP